MNFDIIGLGTCCLDHVGLVPYLPKLDQGDPLLDYTKQGGGPTATAMVTLARLGAKAGFVGKVGDDEAGDFIRDQFLHYGVDISRMVVQKGAKSSLSIVLVDKGTGKRSIIHSKGTFSPLLPRDLDKDYIISGRYLHLDGPSETAITAARWAKEAGVKVSYDAGYFSPRSRQLMELTDILIASKAFAEDFTGESDYRKAAEKLRSLKSELIVITLGEDGSVCLHSEDFFICDTFEVEVIDTTGAGDVFHGAFLYGLLREWDIRRVSEFATAVAAIKCTKLGGRAGIPTLAEAEKFIKEKRG